jgi:hypothetical protein
VKYFQGGSQAKPIAINDVLDLPVDIVKFIVGHAFYIGNHES